MNEIQISEDNLIEQWQWHSLPLTQEHPRWQDHLLYENEQPELIYTPNAVKSSPTSNFNEQRSPVSIERVSRLLKWNDVSPSNYPQNAVSPEAI